MVLVSSILRVKKLLFVVQLVVQACCAKHSRPRKENLWSVLSVYVDDVPVGGGYAGYVANS